MLSAECWTTSEGATNTRGDIGLLSVFDCETVPREAQIQSRKVFPFCKY